MLQEMPDYKIYLRTLAQGKPVGPYVINTYPPFLTNRDRKAAVIQASMQRYGRPRAKVEARLGKFLSGGNS